MYSISPWNMKFWCLLLPYLFGALIVSKSSFADENSPPITWNFGEMVLDDAPDTRLESTVTIPDGRVIGMEAESIANAGDVNGDGIDDLIFGYPSVNYSDQTNGYAAIVFGVSGGVSSELSTGQLDGTNGVVLKGYRYAERAGIDVKGIGDINGDGFDDVGVKTYVGDEHVDTNGDVNGGLYIVFGRPNFPTGDIDLSELDGSNGFYIETDATSRDPKGQISDFSAAGDFDGDGIDDLLVGNANGVHENQWVGKAYLLYGRQNGFPARINVDQIDDVTGVVLHGGDSNYRWVGRYVRSAGDINADGFSDVVVGYIERRYSYSPPQYTWSVVVYGRSGLAGAPRSIATVADVRLPGGTSDYHTRSSGIGDLNGDGIDDLSVPIDYGLGIIFGAPDGVEADLTTENLVNGQGGMYIPRARYEYIWGITGPTAHHRVYEAMAGVVDVDEDGRGDLILSHHAIHHPSGAYDSYDYNSSVVLLNARAWHGKEISYANLDGCQGVIVDRNQRTEASAFLDTNADGKLDYVRVRYGGHDYSGYLTEFFQHVWGQFPVAETAQVLHYDFNGSVGDKSTNCHHLAVTGSLNNTFSSESKSMLLTPTVGAANPARLSLGYRRDVAVRGDLTLRANVRLQNDGYAPIFTRYTNRTVNRRKLPAYSLQTMPNRRVRFSWLRTGSGTVEHCTTRANVLGLRQFNGVTATRDADTGLVRIWVDGRPVRVCRAPAGKLNSTRMAMYVGAFEAGLPASTALIRLDDIKLYSRVLRSTEIRN